MTDASDARDGDFPATDHLPDPFKKDYERLGVEIAELQGRWSRFIDLYGKSQRRIELLQETAPVFFADLQDTYLNAVILGIVRLLDSPETFGEENLVLERLVMASEKVGDGDLANNLSDQLRKLRNHCENLEAWRHKRIGHLDREVAYGEADSEDIPTSIPRDTFEQTFSLIEEFMNTIERYYGGGQIRFDPITTGDANALVANLKKATDHEDLIQKNVLSPIRHQENRLSNA